MFLIGAMKSGTTALADALYHHAFIHKAHQLDCPETALKEIGFFNDGTSFAKGREFYESHFERDLPPGHVSLDATPGYLYEPFVAERVFKMYGKDIKIIAILRDPVERAISHWRFANGRLKYQHIVTLCVFCSTQTRPCGSHQSKGRW